MALLARDDSLLLVIDMQPRFWGERLAAGDQECAREATRRAAWLAATGRRTAVLTGFETDVCVTHSAIGLAEAGYRVVVAEDAVYSPFGAHAPGTARQRDLGFELMRGKSIYYDWIRTLEAARAFQPDHPELADPPGFSLLARNGPDPGCPEATMQPWSRRPG